MRRLFIFYDPGCGLCRQIAIWLAGQPKFIPLQLTPAVRLKEFYPALAARYGSDELLVVSDEGAVYAGNRAWLMCLYALRRYRSWARRLSQPALLPLARSAFAVLSNNRRRISKWLELMTDADLRAQLERVNPPRCHGNC